MDKVRLVRNVYGVVSGVVHIAAGAISFNHGKKTACTYGAIWEKLEENEKLEKITSVINLQDLTDKELETGCFIEDKELRKEWRKTIRKHYVKISALGIASGACTGYGIMEIVCVVKDVVKH